MMTPIYPKLAFQTILLKWLCQEVRCIYELKIRKSFLTVQRPHKLNLLSFPQNLE